MKLNAPILFGISWLLLSLGSLSFLSPVFGGFGILIIISSIFETKNYHNKKVYSLITAVILVTSLILTYYQISSPLYHGNILLESLSALVFSIIIFGLAYEFIKKGRIFETQEPFEFPKLHKFPKKVLWIFYLSLGLVLSFIGFMVLILIIIISYPH